MVGLCHMIVVILSRVLISARFHWRLTVAALTLNPNQGIPSHYRLLINFYGFIQTSSFGYHLFQSMIGDQLLWLLWIILTILVHLSLACRFIT